MTVSTASIAFALKRLYPQNRVENMVYQDNPLLAMIAKEGGFGGEGSVIAVRYADTQGRSAGFTDAQAGAVAGALKGVAFLTTRVKDYQVYEIETEAMLAADEAGKASFLKSLDTEVSSALNNFGRSRAISLYGDGVGSLGTVSVAGTTLTMVNVNDITNVEPGMKIVCSTGATNTAILRNSGVGQTILSVDTDAGTFVIDANTDTITTGDHIFVKGDRQVAAITLQSQYLRLSGLESWNPATAPTSAAFFGVDRSIHPSRLGGLRINISSFNPEEGVTTAMHRLAREGGNPSHLFMNNIDAKNVQVSLGSKAEVEYTGIGEIGFSGIRILGPKGKDVMIYADQNAPSGVGRLLQLDTWKLRYMRELAIMQDFDGATLSRKASSDAYEGRISFYGQLTCTGPGRNARLVMP
jgi:hypothetical protein